MNGIEKITARIRADAADEASRMQEDAVRRCSGVIEEGRRQAEQQTAARLAQGEKEAQEQKNRLLKAADMNARKQILQAKQDLVAEAFDRAEDRLRTLSGAERTDLLSRLAARAAVSGKEAVVLDEEDLPAVQAVVDGANALLSQAGRTAQLTLSPEPGRFSGGLMLREGQIFVNGTIEALLRQAKEELSASVAAGLFSDPA